MHFIPVRWIILVTTFVSTNYCAIHHSSADDDFPPTVCTEVDPTKVFSGTVVNSDGSPVANARIFTTSARAYQPGIFQNVDFFDEEVTTGSDGKYLLSTKRGWANQHVIEAKGYAPQIAPVPEEDNSTITLEPGRTISGKVLGPDGEPLSGATVQMTHWFVPRATKLDVRYEQYRSSNTNLAAPMYKFGTEAAAETDEDGHFEIEDAPLYRVALAVKAPGIVEEVIYVRGIENGREDSRGTDFANQTLISNEAVLVTQRCSTLTLNGFDEDGNSIAISRVSLQPIINTMDDGALRRSVVIGEDGKINLPNFTNKSKVFGIETKSFAAIVEPAEDSMLLGKQIVFDSLSKDDPQDISRDVVFSSGVPLRGTVVDKNTGTGIADVPLLWRSSSFKDIDNDNNLPPTETRTDEAGTFEIVVPDTDGTFGMIGDVSGYRSIFTWNGFPGTLEASEILCIDRYIEKLEGGEIESLPPLQFELSPSYKVDVTVVLENGTPVSDCKVMGKIYKSRPFSGGKSPVERTSSTDELGRCQIDHWYFDDIQLEAALGRDDSPNKVRQPFVNEYPIKLKAFSKSGYVAGATVPLPDPDDESNTIEMTLTLSDPGNVQGQILNFDGKPAAGLTVTASTAGFAGREAGHIWTTETREDGKFLMADFPVGIEAKWTLDGQRAKTTNNNRIEPDLSAMRSRSTLEIPPIRILDLGDLVDPFPEVAIDSPDDSVALQKLSEFAVEQVARLPESSKEINEFVSSRHGGDAIAQYSGRLEEKLIPLIEELADRDAGGEYELQVLSQASTWFVRKHKPGTIPYFGISMEGTRITKLCHERLMTNQIEREEAQSLLVQLTSKVDQRSYNDRTKAWKELKEKTPFEKTKANADCHIAIGKVWDVQQQCLSGVSNEDFQLRIKEMKSAFTSSLITNRNLADPAHVSRLENVLTQIKRNMEHSIKETSARPQAYFNAQKLEYKTDRAQTVIDMLEKFVSNP
jgi:hypothetical protein